MFDCTCEPRLSPVVLRYVRAYKPRFRALVLGFLKEKQSAVPNLHIEDVQECIAMAFGVFEADISARVAFPEPDPSTMRAALEDYRAGRYQTGEEILRELS